MTDTCVPTTSGPENTNLAQPTKFIVTFPEISTTVFFCQRVNLPGVQLSPVPHPTPGLDLYTPGVKLEYNTLDMSFLVNEDLSSWMTIYNWMKDLSSNTTKYKDRTKKTAIVTYLSNLNNPKLRVIYNDIFPISLGDLEYDTTMSADEHITSTASFRYDYFDVERL